MTSSSLIPAQHAGAVLSVLLGAAAGCTGDRVPAASDWLHGPHGGHTAVMSEGAGFEIEFTLDATRRRIVLYVHEEGGAAAYPLPVDSLSGQFKADGRSTDVTFAADPRSDDPPGHASRFVLALDTLPQQLLASDEFELMISYRGDGGAATASIPHKNDHAHSYRHD